MRILLGWACLAMMIHGGPLTRGKCLSPHDDLRLELYFHVTDVKDAHPCASWLMDRVLRKEDLVLSYMEDRYTCSDGVFDQRTGQFKGFKVRFDGKRAYQKQAIILHQLSHCSHFDTFDPHFLHDGPRASPTAPVTTCHPQDPSPFDDDVAKGTNAESFKEAQSRHGPISVSNLDEFRNIARLASKPSFMPKSLRTFLIKAALHATRSKDQVEIEATLVAMVSMFVSHRCHEGIQRTTNVSMARRPGPSLLRSTRDRVWSSLMRQCEAVQMRSSTFEENIGQFVDIEELDLSL